MTAAEIRVTAGELILNVKQKLAEGVASDRLQLSLQLSLVTSTLEVAAQLAELNERYAKPISYRPTDLQAGKTP